MTPDEIESWVKATMNLGSPLFTVFACVILGYFFRAIPKFNNDYLWIVCGSAGAVIFPVLALPHRAMYGHDEGLIQWILRSIIMGLTLGLGAWAFHDKILKKYEDKIPLLKIFVGMVDRAGKN